MSDQIADMLSRIRNGTSGRRTRVDVPQSRLKTEIARILQSEGYILGFKVVESTAVRKRSLEERLVRAVGTDAALARRLIRRGI